MPFAAGLPAGEVAATRGKVLTMFLIFKRRGAGGNEAHPDELTVQPPRPTDRRCHVLQVVLFKAERAETVGLKV